MLTHRIWAFLLFFGAFLTLQPVHATMVLPQGLDNLHAKAKYIFLGDCLENKVALDPVSGRVATFTTFQILESLKGDPGTTYTIKQVGGQLPDSPIVTHIVGVPQFEVGKRYLVFLPAASRIGFASPVGLTQGVFTASENPSGETVVSNGRDVADLLETVTPDKIPPGMASKMHLVRTPTNAQARKAIRLDDVRSLLQGMPQP